MSLMSHLPRGVYRVKINPRTLQNPVGNTHHETGGEQVKEGGQKEEARTTMFLRLEADILLTKLWVSTLSGTHLSPALSQPHAQPHSGSHTIHASVTVALPASSLCGSVCLCIGQVFSQPCTLASKVIKRLKQTTLFDLQNLHCALDLATLWSDPDSALPSYVASIHHGAFPNLKYLCYCDMGPKIQKPAVRTEMSVQSLTHR